MPNLVEITDLSAPELDVYARLTETQLRNKLEPEKGMFIAESPKVIGTALDAGYRPLSFLMERRQVEGPAAGVLARCPEVPVYTADRSVLEQLTGYVLTRGVPVRHASPGAPHGGRGLPGCPPGGRAGGHRGFHQHRSHLPLGGSPGDGCGVAFAVLLRPAVPAGHPGEHGHGVPGALGQAGGPEGGLAPGRSGPAAHPGLYHGGHGTG